MAVQNATPKEVLTFPGIVDATAKPVQEPRALPQENHEENTPSFPCGEQSIIKTLPKACKSPADVPCNTASPSTFCLCQVLFLWLNPISPDVSRDKRKPNKCIFIALTLITSCIGCISGREINGKRK